MDFVVVCDVLGGMLLIVWIGYGRFNVWLVVIIGIIVDVCVLVGIIVLDVMVDIFGL